MTLANPNKFPGSSISFDATSETKGNDNTSTHSHTIGTNSNRLLVVGVSYTKTVSQETVSNPTYGGQEMTLAVLEEITGYVQSCIYYLKNPTSGTDDIVVNFSDDVPHIVGAVSFAGVRQSESISGVGGTTGTSTSPSNITTAENGDVVVDCLAARLGGFIASATPDGSQTERWNQNVEFIQPGQEPTIGAGSTKQGSGNVTTSWTLSSSKRWVLTGVAVKPVFRLVSPDKFVNPNNFVTS